MIIAAALLLSGSVFAQENPEEGLPYGIENYLLPFIRGDANSDGRIDITDPITVLNYLFRGGGEPRCPDAFDATDDGTVDITDAIRILNHLFTGAQQIAPPFTDPGVDPTPDDPLDCEKEFPEQDSDAPIAPAPPLPGENPDTPPISQKPKICEVEGDEARMSAKGIEVLKKLEGSNIKEGKHVPYTDNPKKPEEGYCTVGYGHALHKGACTNEDKTLTEDEAIELLKADLKIREDELFNRKSPEPLVKKEVAKKLETKQCDAVISLHYNAGGIFPISKARTQLNLENFYGKNSFTWEAFHPEFGIVKDKAGGVILLGLQRRRAVELELFKNGHDEAIKLADNLFGKGEDIPPFPE